jgi:hypothetical protein
MTRTKLACLAVLAALMCTGSAEAHHSGSMYATTPIWIEGTVVRFESIDPHTTTTLEERGEDGQIRLWAVEGPAQFQLGRVAPGGEIPQVGEVLEFCAFPYKSPEELAQLFPAADFSATRAAAAADSQSPKYVAGHVMVMPNGAMHVWEPHGIISACIASSNIPRQSWIDFLSSNTRARQAFCEQRDYAIVQSNASLRDLVEQVNSAIDNRCS